MVPFRCLFVFLFLPVRRFSLSCFKDTLVRDSKVGSWRMCYGTSAGAATRETLLYPQESTVPQKAPRTVQDVVDESRWELEKYRVPYGYGTVPSEVCLSTINTYSYLLRVNILIAFNLLQ